MELNIHEYQLRQGNNIYILKICVTENAIRLSCKNLNGKNYSRDFLLYDFKSIDPFFDPINNEQDAIEYIDKALNVHKVAIVEESGVLKIIFYVITKGLINTVEIPLGESGKSLLQSKLDSLNNIGPAQKTFENTNINPGEVGTYGQNSYYNLPNTTPITGNRSSTMANYNANEYQYQKTQNYNNYQNQRDNNQYTQSNYDNTNVSIGTYQANGINENNPNSYNYNQYEGNSSNIYTTNNNYNYSNTTNNYDTTSYEINSNSYGATQLNVPFSYENSSYQYNQYSQYNQPIIESTSNTQVYSGYKNAATRRENVPTITPVNETEPTPTLTAQYNTQIQGNQTLPIHKTTVNAANNKNIKQQHTKQLSAQTFNKRLIQSHDDIINKLEGDTNNLKNETHELQSKLNNKIGEMEKQRSLSELSNLKFQTTEVQTIKDQLAQLSPIKKQIEEMASLKKQLIELNSLRAKVAELSAVKNQVHEINKLRQEVSQVNMLKKQIEELKTSQSQKESEMTKSLKKKIQDLEKSNMEYEKEIKLLRNKTFEGSSKQSTSVGLESKKIMFEEDPSQKCVKGEIIHETKELEMITRKINKLNKKLTINLLYKASADSDKAEVFHSKCDAAKSTIVLVETDKGKRFGGFTACSWVGDCVEKKDEDAFIFSLDKMKTYDNIKGESAIGCYPKFGPIFLGCQIRIYDNAFKKGGTTFEKGLNFNTEEDFELTGGDRSFKIKDIEVYEVIPQ